MPVSGAARPAKIAELAFFKRWLYKINFLLFPLLSKRNAFLAAPLENPSELFGV